MKTTLLLLLCLLLSLVEVHSQTEYPYVSFMGETLPNHAYVDLSLVGSDGSGSDSVQCHTDLTTCCTGSQGPDRGDWFFPSNEMKLPFIGPSADIYEARGSQRVDLRRKNNGDMPSGIYRCDIETHPSSSNDSFNKTTHGTVYIGLYISGGMVSNFCLHALRFNLVHIN